MKSGWANFVKDYLTFSKKERWGISLVLLICLFFYFFPRYYSAHQRHTGPQAFQAELAQLKISIDTSTSIFRYDNTNSTYPSRSYKEGTGAEKQLFVFDPNTLDVAGWKRLGVREKTIATIQHFIGKGFRFRQPEDLRKIYGLPAREADRLVPYVRIYGNQPAISNEANNVTVHKYPVRERDRLSALDINVADTAAFISLPGIGSKLAARIVHFRQKLGGFCSIDQLGETYGIPDSTFQKIRPYLRCNNPAITKINVNTAKADELKVHPYIRWNLANAIVSYRNQHGTYHSLDDLRQIEIMNDELFTKIAPYLTLQ